MDTGSDCGLMKCAHEAFIAADPSVDIRKEPMITVIILCSQESY